MSPGRAPGRPGKRGDGDEERVRHVSQRQGREARKSLGRSYMTESLSLPRRRRWTQSPSDPEPPCSDLPCRAARASGRGAGGMSAAPR